MNGIITKLGFTIWAKNLAGRAFAALHRDLIKTRLLSNQSNQSFRGFMHQLRRETRAARGFGTVLMGSIIAPLVGAGGAFAGAAAGIAAVGAAMAGMMAVGIIAADKLQKKFDNFKEYNKDLKATLDETFSAFMDDIAPAFFDALDQVKSSMREIGPIMADMFRDLAPMTAPVVKAMTDLAKIVLPAIGDVFTMIGPHMPAFIKAFSGVADLITAIGKSLDKLAPSVNPIIVDLLDIMTSVLGPDFFGALGPLLDGLHGFFEAAKPGLNDFLVNFADALNALAPALPALGEFLSELLRAAGPILVTVAERLATKLPGILDNLGDFVDFLGEILDNEAVVDTLLGIAAAYMAISAAVKAANAAMAVFSMLTLGGSGKTGANGKGKPGVVGAAGKGGIAALVGALGADAAVQAIYGIDLGQVGSFVRGAFNEGFSNGGGLLGGLKNVFTPGSMPGIEKATKKSPFGQFAEGFNPSATINGNGQPRELGGFAAFGQNMKWARQNVTTFFQNLSKNLSGAADNVTQWFQNLSKNISGAADNVTQWFENLGKNISGTVDNVTQWFQNLGKNMRGGVSNGVAAIKRIFFGIGPWFLQYVVMPVKNFFTQTIPQAATNLRVQTIAAWNKLKDKIKSIKDSIYSQVVVPIKNFFTKTIPTAAVTMATKLRDAFGKARTWVGQQWDKLSNIVKSPVNWIITNVYNNGIRALWNKVANAVGAKGLDKMSLIGSRAAAAAGGKTAARAGGKGLARGGRVFGGPPGIDTVQAYGPNGEAYRLNNDEHIITSEEVARAGGHAAIMRWRSMLMGGRSVSDGSNGGYMYKDGGIVGKALSLPKKLFSGDWIRGALSGVADPILDVLTKGIDTLPDKPSLSAMMKSFAKKPIDWIRDWLSKDDAKHAALVDTGGGLWSSMFNWIKARIPGTRLMSGNRPGDWGYHGKGQAVDLGFSDRSEYGPGMHGLAAKAFNLIKKTFKPNIAELIWDFAGSKAVWNGKDHFFTGASAGPGTHNNHIHWAMARAVGAIAGSGGKVGGSWSSVASAVLRELGLLKGDNLSNVLRAIQKESGGNPRAINNWDINAQNGIPSKGLLQTIDPTFNAWAGKYRSRGVYDPYANIYAAVRYARNRYGAGWSARMAQPGGYKGGTASAARGWKWVGENGPEKVFFNGGEEVKKAGSRSDGDSVIINFNGPVFGDKRAIEDAVVKAVHDAQRTGRIRK